MEQRVIATNRKARHDYHIIEAYEAGIALVGPEVKSVRQGNVNLKDGYVAIEKGECFLHNVHINPYVMTTNTDVPEAERPRKLLLHRSQIRKIEASAAQKGLTVVPLKIYLKRGIVKVEIALCRGKKSYDKRDAIKKRSVERDIRKALKGKYLFILL